jgi:ribosomal protein L7/L12
MDVYLIGTIAFVLGFIAGRISKQSPSLSARGSLTTTKALPEDIEARARELLKRNDKIEAIKQVREATGMGLKESKEFVEQLERQ